MEQWRFLWSEPVGWTIIASLAIALVAVVVAGLAVSRLRRHEAQWSGLLRGSKGGSLERLLNEHLRRHEDAGSRTKEAEGRLDSLESRMASSKRYIGLVRFDAFEEIGGQQSFALAIYDERGYGIVLSSLVGRSDCRVYCKRLKGGRADNSLTDEEQSAIDAAVAAPEKVNA